MNVDKDMRQPGFAGPSAAYPRGHNGRHNYGIPPQRQAHSALTPFEQGETNDFCRNEKQEQDTSSLKKAKTAHFRLAITFH